MAVLALKLWVVRQQIYIVQYVVALPKDSMAATVAVLALNPLTVLQQIETSKVVVTLP